jgi:hypothetical protein
MKKFGIVMLFALMLTGMMACEQSGKGDGKDGDSTAVATPAPATTTPTDPNATTAEPAPTIPMTTVQFIEEAYNFGEVPEGDKVNHTFKFKNTGANPLRVNNVKPSCGCTTPDWSKEDIAPGAEGFVTVEFDSKGKDGIQKKSVTVTFENTDPRNKVLNFTAEVSGGSGDAH